MENKRPEPQLLLDWYSQMGRELPWRKTADPYKIWISEIMLQQTTVTAVKPFFDRFIKSFPTAIELANAPLSDVLEAWSGLGYYSRARNLHKCAQLFVQNGFPKTHSELIKLPGLGPYTSRAIASFAFREPVAVLDGNVIRFLSRYYGQPFEWWKQKERQKLQNLADEWVQGFDSHNVNQALIELGAMVCTSRQPKCTTCPMIRYCSSVGSEKIDQLPITKPKKNYENWVWEVYLYEKNNKVALIKNESISVTKKNSKKLKPNQNKKSSPLQKDKKQNTQKTHLPVLKNQWIWPGSARRVKLAPKQFSFQHAVTHHKIFVKVNYIKSNTHSNQLGQIKWFKKSELRKINPASLVHKVLSLQITKSK